MAGFVPKIRNHIMQMEQNPAVTQATEVTAAVLSSVHALACCSVTLSCWAQAQEAGLYEL